MRRVLLLGIVVAATIGAPMPTAIASPGVGGSIVLHGYGGVRMKVTVLRVINPARVDEFYTPAPGKKYVAVKVSLRNVGHARYSDAPSNGAALIYSGGRQADADITTEGACVPLGAETKISPGGKRVGCLYFLIPKRSRPHLFQFALDSGFANQTGEWKLT